MAEPQVLRIPVVVTTAVAEVAIPAAVTKRKHWSEVMDKSVSATVIRTKAKKMGLPEDDGPIYCVVVFYNDSIPEKSYCREASVKASMMAVGFPSWKAPKGY